MAPRIGKYLLAAALLTLSVGLYGAHRHQGEGGDELDGLRELGLAGSEAEQALYRRALERLEERLAHYPEDYEASLLKGLLQFRSGRLIEAQQELAQLTRRAPKFHLAHLVQGDLLLAQTQTVTDIGTTPLLAGLTSQEAALEQLRAEAEARLSGYLDTLPQDRLPRALLTLGESVQTAIVVDKSSHRLYIYERQEAGAPPRLVRDFYVSTGKANGNKVLRGDLRTPEGVYFITRHIPSSALPEKYGSSAYPLNYPNELDQRQGKTGDGIWLHGTDDAFYSRPPLDSEGCVVLPNIDLDRAAAYIRPGVTPLVITERVEWIDADTWRSLRDELLAALEGWRNDWASGDVERYLGHYTTDFYSTGYDLKKWQARKRAVAQGKRYQEVALADVSLFAYPRSASNGRELMVVNFQQRYRSNNFDSDMGKRLYLAREDGQWRVLYEGGQ